MATQNVVISVVHYKCSEVISHATCSRGCHSRRCIISINVICSLVVDNRGIIIVMA